MRRAILLSAALLFANVEAPVVHADLLQGCGYPATGYYVRADVIIATGILYACDMPTEENGSHWHAELLAIDVGFNSGFNLGNILGTGSGVGGNAGASITIGGAVWTASYRCANERLLAKLPNPYIGWTRAMKPRPCDATGTADSGYPDPQVFPPAAGDADVPYTWPPSLKPGSPPPQISSPSPIPPPPVALFGGGMSYRPEP